MKMHFAPVIERKNYIFHITPNEENPNIKSETISRKYEIAQSSINRQYAKNIISAHIINNEFVSVRDEYRNILEYVDVGYLFVHRTVVSIMKSLEKGEIYEKPPPYTCENISGAEFSSQTRKTPEKAEERTG
jgi:hypothetical protein